MEFRHEMLVSLAANFSSELRAELADRTEDGDRRRRTDCEQRCSRYRRFPRRHDHFPLPPRRTAFEMRRRAHRAALVRLLGDTTPELDVARRFGGAHRRLRDLTVEPRMDRSGCTAGLSQRNFAIGERTLGACPLWLLTFRPATLGIQIVKH